ncbi:MAG: hypothetical protein WCX31_22270, partial [Salinivirgaceae bacterium]
MRRFLFLLINLLIISCTVYTQNALIPSQSKTNKPIPVLIVDGFSNHDWRQTTILTKWMLEESGLFKADVSTIPSDSLQRLNWRPKFNDYAVVIQNTNNIFTP